MRQVARLYGTIALIAAVMTVALSATTVPKVLHGTLLDPDSYMRLLRIRQGFAAGHLVNVVRRDDSGHLLVVEWSRLFDAAIVALAAPLAPFIGWPRALAAAGIATGPLTSGLLAAGIAFAAAPICGRRWLLALGVIVPLLPGIYWYSILGVIHYHIAQVAVTALAIGATLRAGQGQRGMAWAAGIWGGIAIWVMPETMPFVLLGYGALGYIWLFRRLGFAVARAGAGFAGTLWLALWLDPPHGGMAVAEIDRLSIVYANLGIAVMAAGLWLAWLDRVPDGRRRGVLGVAGAGIAFVAWLSAYPIVALGPYALIPPDTVHAFFGSIAEDRPTSTFASVASHLGVALLALGYVLYRAWRDRGDRAIAGAWLFYAAGLGLATGLTARMIIFQQYPAALAAGMAPVALAEISDRWQHEPRKTAFMRLSLVWLPILLSYVPTIAQAALAKTAPKSEHCTSAGAIQLVAPLSGKIVLTSPGIVPELLYRTRIIGVGSLYHHGIAAYMRSWHAWRAVAGRREPAAVRATGAQFVLFCPAESRTPIARGAPSGALLLMLGAGHVPPWLTPVGAAEGYQLYRIGR